MNEIRHHDECDCDECSMARANRPAPARSIARFTLKLAMIWAAFRMIADLTRRTANALSTPAALAILAWLLWTKN